ncbi:imidazole glycerol phosphate synthase, glutamine amidotransferase subunit [Candidatus Kuenenbacteria bacterium RIFCSPHIGHO2_02_FULL_39_13]|uniref:Imidazole glycerol phosphate synthase subunit HisH n=1 Tax=Candidatus Kuenenbacteria bacterium RIFCSPHIGHO2_02_FULL_39_13 TaxID=1798561 RepID=A0A1F6FN15_9BACT|nr:MAG: imidazole glycerol phosphate synthase, glutamine amidotransferase subunit [Candidatus Kuenenbacteria bacterium RIFCSPHIGHO2_02_FULL_39_13]
MDKKICILDYGSGNVKSVFNIVGSIVQNTVISNKADDIRTASHIILPGVGSFGAAMEKIRHKIPLDILTKEVLSKKKPFLGICVGMQVLAAKGFEFGDHPGLGWISGVVDKLDSGQLPLPHIGWNNIDIINSHPLLQGLNNNQDFYFVHSYVFQTSNQENIIATTQYGQRFNSIISKENISGVQFHPEKSQKAGKLLLSNFFQMR